MTIEQETNHAFARSRSNVGLGKPDIVHRLYNDSPNYSDAVEAGAEIQHLRSLLNPRMWTKEMHDEWHRKIPDVQAAFDALRGVPNAKLSTGQQREEEP